MIVSGSVGLRKNGVGLNETISVRARSSTIGKSVWTLDTVIAFNFTRVTGTYYTEIETGKLSKIFLAHQDLSMIAKVSRLPKTAFRVSPVDL